MNYVPEYASSHKTVGKKKTSKTKLTQGRSAAAWAGLENNKKGNATLAYNSVRKDATAHNYHVSKEEAARIAKKYPTDPAHAVQRARAHHGVTVSKKTKKKK